MTILGLPLHPLIVHLVVVFVPLAAIGGVVVSLWTWARDRYGWLVLAAGSVALVSTIVARQTGFQFYDSFKQHSPAMDRHMQIASPLVWWTIGLFVGEVALMAGWLMTRRGMTRAKIVHWAGVVITVVFALISLVVVLQAGHAGATAVWG